MNRTSFLLLAAVVSLPQVVQANGGGYSYGVHFTGSVAPFQASGTEHVRIRQEVLTVRLQRTQAAVRVWYVMENVSATPVKVRFGFPVEAIAPSTGDEEMPFSPETRADVLAALPQAIQQLEGYTVTAGGKPVPARFEVEPFATGKLQPFPGSERLAGIGGWMVSEVEFLPGVPLSVEIGYSASYTGETVFISEDLLEQPRSFLYRLSTGAVWNGPIERGLVTVLADGIAPEEVEFVAPRERFVRQGPLWTWTFENLEPTLADDLSIRAIPGYSEYGVYDAPGSRGILERSGAFGEGHQRYQTLASSTLASDKQHSYTAMNLARPSSGPPWAEGVEGDGVGEWVELTPRKPRPLLALGIVPGLVARDKPALYAANGRPTRVEVLLNGEHRFEASLGSKGVGLVTDIQLVPVIGYAKPVSTVRITLLEVQPGTKYRDTCISRVVLYDRIPKPKTKLGAR